MRLSVTVTVMSDGTAVLSVRGEVDHSNAGELRDAIRGIVANRRPHTVRVDLGLVTFIDSGAIGALVSAHRECTAEGARLVVANTSPFVFRQLEVTGVSLLLGAQPTRPESPPPAM